MIKTGMIHPDYSDSTFGAEVSHAISASNFMPFLRPFSHSFHAQIKEIRFSFIFLSGRGILRFVR